MKKKIIKTVALCLVSVTVLTVGGVFLVNAIKNREVFNETETAYSYVNVSYGKAKRQKFDMRIPKTASGKTGVIVNIHGGGWQAGDKSGYANELVSWADKGYVTIAVNYRYANGKNVGYDEMLADVDTALSLAKSKAENHGVELDKALFTGGSAGAHLSLSYAYEYKNKSPVKPSAVVAFSPPTDLSDINYLNVDKSDAVLDLFCKVACEKFDRTNFANYGEILKKCSPVYYLTAETGVPTILCYGMKEELIPKSNVDDLAEKLELLGVKHDVLYFENSGHGLESDPKTYEQALRLYGEYAMTYLN